MAEVKATRRKGITGANKGRMAPFRLNGLPANRTERALRGVSADHSGTHKVQAAIGGLLAAKLGFWFPLTERMALLVDTSMERAPTATFVLDSLEPEETPQAIAAE